MRIFRVEDESGTGPYYADVDLRRMWAAHNGPNHPLPRNDGMAPVTPWEVFGFESMEKLHEWFRGFEEDLDRAGFSVSTYEIEEWRVKRGLKQVAFNVECATLVGSERLCAAL